MINNREKFDEVLKSNDISTIRSFLDNCILWDASYKKEISKYVEELVGKNINGELIFQEDDGIDLSKFDISEDSLSRLATESMFNFSKEKYLCRLEIANELAKKREKESEQKQKDTKVLESNNKSKDDDKKKKIALAVGFGIIVGAGTMITMMIMKK